MPVTDAPPTSPEYRAGYADGYHAALLALSDMALWQDASYREALDAAMRHWRAALLDWQHADGAGDPPGLAPAPVRTHAEKSN